MKAIIVDDEKAAREILNNLLARFCGNVEVLATCNDVESAVIEIKSLKPDLVFLDVEMPKYAGYEITRFFEKIDFKIIFVTAYDKYAIKAFEVSALDYLLKPLEIDQLKKAVRKANDQVLLESYKKKLEVLSSNIKKSEKKYSYIDKGYTMHVAIENIIAFEAQRAYTKMYLTNYSNIIVSKNIKTIEEELRDFNSFYRVHRSWIINKSHLEKYSKSSYELHLTENIIAKISRQYKLSFEDNIANG